MKKVWRPVITITLIFMIVQAGLPFASAAGITAAAADYSVASYADFIETVARQYIARDTDFTIKYTAGLNEVQNNISSNDHLWEDVFAVDIPDFTSDLDYLHHNMSEMRISWRYSGTYAICELTQSYLTTAAEEKYVNTSAGAIISKLDLGDDSVYGKIKAIHDYIVDHVAYDFTYSRFSAYDALYSRSAVCQGYALLMYKLLTEAGIPVRFISGEAVSGGSSGPHAWNIVKIGQYWYNVDVTWDDSLGSTAFMLKNDAAFSDHYRDSIYSTSAFNAAHPMSPVDFDLTRDVRPPVPETPSAWALEDINALNARGVIPAALKSVYQSSITRAEFMALIANVYQYARGPYTPRAGAPFNDVSSSAYSNEILVGYELGIISGSGSGLFEPDNTLTREQCAKIVSNAVKAINGCDISSNAAVPYGDITQISGWALPYIRYAYESGLMVGSEGSFNPQTVLTREQAMMIAERMIEKYSW